MGMCLGLCSINATSLQKVLADPPLIWRVIAPDDPEAYEMARPKRGLLGRMFGGKAPPAQDLVLGKDEVQGTDLDKAWHGIHYLLTGTAHEGEGPISWLLTGGEDVGDVDVGYGPARALSPAEVREFQQALAAVTPEDLRARFNPVEMRTLNIYPDIWDRDPAEDDSLGYCLDYFKVLRSFVDETVSRKQALVIYLT
jgi:hypothetical protein